GGNLGTRLNPGSVAMRRFGIDDEEKDTRLLWGERFEALLLLHAFLYRIITRLDVDNVVEQKSDIAKAVMSHGFEIVQTLITDIEPPEQPRPRRRNRERMQQLDSSEFVL
uniref:Uncharacterized protein n=1 Tax=Chenopodium quinoa TaxID=63459 RepID=A0A803N8T6_CHEQI